MEQLYPTNAHQRLRVLTVNIQAGLSTRRYIDYVLRGLTHALPIAFAQQRASLNTIAALASQHDIVGIQECDPGSLRSGFTNQTHYLAAEAAFAHWTHQLNRRTGFIASSANALLSKLPPYHAQSYALPGRIKGRGMLVAKFGEGKNGLAVAVTHLSLGSKARKLQFAFIAEILHDHPNAILMGDFNCTIDHPDMQILFDRTGFRRPTHPLLTFPSWQPRRAIDHILVSGIVQILHITTTPAAFSDHLAISVTIDLPCAILRKE